MLVLHLDGGGESTDASVSSLTTDGSLHLTLVQNTCTCRVTSLLVVEQEVCYGSDRFSGWTPDSEEGMHLKAFEDETWRHPFRSKSTIYGRIRGQDST